MEKAKFPEKSSASSTVHDPLRFVGLAVVKLAPVISTFQPVAVRSRVKPVGIPVSPKVDMVLTLASL